ncbi:YbaY family lipoprotein [Rhodanobacter sp. 115]|uniref:YbaY family lipoprotein n=1 Tax=Rhodanobacter sp. FW021-MT20 TaxID=1162282 RepID=UPI000561CEF6|nr:YbaY family lipoprotein [Rhodanobacter sp. 115]
MRMMVWPLVAAVSLALAGCNSGSSTQAANGANPAAAGSAAQASAHSVSGTITIRGSDKPSASDKLVINLVDVSQQGSTPLATKTIAPATTFPLQFELGFNTADVVPNDLYVVKAELIDGDRHYEMPLQAPVLTKGHPVTNVSIELVPQQTPGEKELAAFQAEQKQLGAMKIHTGTKLEKDISYGWQVFRQNDQVQFIRARADRGDKGFTATDFAYKDGKPWVVVQQKKANQGAKPSSIDRAGWSADGTLVLKQHEASGKVSPLDDSDAASLKQQALDMLNMATGGKGN